MTPSKGPVCVTGAGGFIASWIVRGLLERGYTVHGTVRSVAGRSAHLTSLDGAAELLRLYAADLLVPGSFSDAIAGCAAVVHTASPYAIAVKDPQHDLVDPAVNGTLNVLETCAQSPSVARVVLTSSLAALTDQPDSHRVLTEEDWNARSTLDRNPYYYSKTLAEHAAWGFVKGQRPGFDLVAINPFFVIGPSLGPELNATNKVLADILKGAYPGILSLSWGIVDVRDVALAHIRALEVAEANGRYICATDAVSMRQVVQWMAEMGYGGPDHKLPKLGLDNAAGNLVVKLASYLQPAGVGTYLRTHIGGTPRYDTSKLRSELGVQYRPVKQTLRETLDDLKRWGHI
jgi:dihydroflavonol-4-reductase